MCVKTSVSALMHTVRKRYSMPKRRFPYVSAKTLEKDEILAYEATNVFACQDVTAILGRNLVSAKFWIVPENQLGSNVRYNNATIKHIFR